MSYKVRAGDTLSAIAARNNVSLAALEKANPQIRNPNLIQVGQAINIPGQKDDFAPPKSSKSSKSSGSTSGGTYVVQAGDTMSSIASRHGVSLGALEQANPQVRNPNLINIGQKLNLPGGAAKTAPSAPVQQSVPGDVGTWIAQAQSILEKAGVPMSKMNAQDIAIIIQHESSGNPNAVNNWDSNAKAGHPSEGLMQTIGPTFNEYKLPGHDNIFNPVDNIIAGVRYAIARYGSISEVPGIIAVNEGRPYVGY